MGEVVVTRMEYVREPRRSRNLEERLMVRFPGAYRALLAAGQRLFSPRSRLRRATLRREWISAYAAASRRDYELMLVRYAADVEVEFDPGMQSLGLGGTYRGHDGLLTIIERFGDAWEDWTVAPAWAIDMGDRFLGLGHFRLPGTASGLEFTSEFAQVLTFTRGLVSHEREFLSWENGLRAAGLDPDLIGQRTTT